MYDSIPDSELLPIDDLYHPCFGNSQAAWHYGTNDPSRSSLVILAGTLAASRTIQFAVNITNRTNAAIQGTGYVLVRVENLTSPLILIG